MTPRSHISNDNVNHTQGNQENNHDVDISASYLRKRTISGEHDYDHHSQQQSHQHLYSNATDTEWYQNAFANLRVLKITALSFFLFVVAEVVGAFVSNSLSLLGDASAMSMDVSTYVISIFVGKFQVHTYSLTFLLTHTYFLIYCME